MTDEIVIYHANCSDGMAAAAICKGQFGDAATYVAAQYGNPIDVEVEGKEVYFVDFSAPADVITEMASKAKKITILDHHQSALDNLGALDLLNVECVLDMDRCGSMITWGYFYPDTDVPLFLRYIQDRDLWQWTLPDSKEFSEGVKTVKKDINIWAMMVGGGNVMVQSMVTRGKPILRHTKRVVEGITRKHALGAFVEVDGGLHEVVPFFNTFQLISELGHAKAEEYPYCVVWFQNIGGSFVYSMRSSADNPNHADVCAIAQKYGGGGHRHAAGFQSKEIVHHILSPEEREEL